MTADGLPHRIDRLPGGEVHAVGAAGLETASMVRYLVEGGRDDIVLHDTSETFEASFATAHRHQPTEHRLHSQAALARCRDLRTGPDYLGDVESAAAILVPVSWFLHPANARLGPLAARFVSYADACFDLWPGPVIGVTGSYGKTTTTRFAAALTGGISCGNDRQSFFDLGALATQPPGRVMAFEASNRHLRNGFRRVLDVGVLSAISLNHEPDHGSFEAYRRVKYSMAARCRRFLYHVAIPAAYPDALPLTDRGASYGNGGDWRPVAEAVAAVEGPGGRSCPVQGLDRLPPLDHDNVVAATAAALLCGVSPEEIALRAGSLAAHRPDYRHAAREVAGRLFINDAASCMPACTAALVTTLHRRFVLICGGDRQRYRPGEFDPLARAVAANPHAALVCATGPMAAHIQASLASAGFAPVIGCADLGQALARALDVTEAVVVFSPGCGTGTLFVDPPARGEAFDDAVSQLVPSLQTAS